MRTYSPHPDDWVDDEIATLREAIEQGDSEEPADAPRAGRVAASNGRPTVHDASFALRRGRFGIRARRALRRRLPSLLAYGAVLALTTAVGWLVASHT